MNMRKPARFSNGIDKVLIHRKITLIAKDLRELKPISLLSQIDYFKKIDYEILAERYLERIITRMIDINYHLIVASNNPPPKDYFTSFTELVKLRILPRDFAERLAKYAGLRNRLVHEYNTLDERKVYLAVKSIVKDLPHYLDYIEEFIERKEKKLL
jgi:uncharacterized protein YutE (UPF0331/DUF86 family)